jgi:hypothetical protein
MLRIEPCEPLQIIYIEHGDARGFACGHPDQRPMLHRLNTCCSNGPSLDERSFIRAARENGKVAQAVNNHGSMPNVIF